MVIDLGLGSRGPGRRVQSLHLENPFFVYLDLERLSAMREFISSATVLFIFSASHARVLQLHHRVNFYLSLYYLGLQVISATAADINLC